MYMCASGIDFVVTQFVGLEGDGSYICVLVAYILLLHNLLVAIWNCSDVVAFFLFYCKIILNRFQFQL